jgi:hypothetical protein
MIRSSNATRRELVAFQTIHGVTRLPTTEGSPSMLNNSIDCSVTTSPNSLPVTAQGIVCRGCGACGPHVVGPGAGPHHARLVCRACSAFMKWLPKPRKDTV